jgi:hypothetical protein
VSEKIFERGSGRKRKPKPPVNYVGGEKSQSN